MSRPKTPNQPALFEYEKPIEGTCAGGYPHPCGGTKPLRAGGCPGCRRLCADGIKAFRAAVRAGKYNRAGYTRADWQRAGRPAKDWKDAPGVRRAFSKRSRLAVPDAAELGDRD